MVSLAMVHLLIIHSLIRMLALPEFLVMMATKLVMMEIASTMMAAQTVRLMSVMSAQFGVNRAIRFVEMLNKKLIVLEF